MYKYNTFSGVDKVLLRSAAATLIKTTKGIENATADGINQPIFKLVNNPQTSIQNS